MNKTIPILATLALSGAAHAAVTQIANYQLGEASSVGASAPFTPLTDNIGGHNITQFNSSATQTIIAAGSAVQTATGSTSALQLSGNGGGATWYSSSFNGNAGYTDDWAFSLWLRPDNNLGTFLGATDGDGGTGTGVRWHATNSSFSGTSLGGKTLSSGSQYLNMSTNAGFLSASTATYTLGQWYKVGLIQYNGTLNYYLNDVLQDSATMSAKINDIRLGAGYFASSGSNGAFDEMKVFTFDHTVDSLSSVQSALTAVPEPSTYGLLGAGALASVALVRRRRRAA